MQFAFLCELNAESGWAGCHKFTLFPGFGRLSAGLISMPYAVKSSPDLS
jgi:hypothetical protein